MGGCASRPKDLDSKQEPLIAEDATSPKKAEGETVVPQEDNGGETKKEEPLVDVSEPVAQEAAKTEEPSTESRPEVASSEEAKPKEEAKPSEEPKKEAAEETKVEEKKEVKQGEEKPKEGAAAATAAAAAPAPSSGDKSDAPLVTL